MQREFKKLTGGTYIIPWWTKFDRADAAVISCTLKWGEYHNLPAELRDLQWADTALFVAYEYAQQGKSKNSHIEMSFIVHSYNQGEALIREVMATNATWPPPCPAVDRKRPKGLPTSAPVINYITRDKLYTDYLWQIIKHVPIVCYQALEWKRRNIPFIHSWPVESQNVLNCADTLPNLHCKGDSAAAR